MYEPCKFPDLSCTQQALTERREQRKAVSLGGLNWRELRDEGPR